MLKFSKAFLPVLTVFMAIVSACSTQDKTQEQNESTAATVEKVSLWPQGITYEIFVRAFADADGDGIGDIKGMTSKLDYLQDLGVEAVWLMPIMKSPTYHKYDVVDYYAIDPEYGTMEDFKTFIAEAHKRDIKVVIDYVINHTGRDHPWFQEAAKDKNSSYRDYYVWADEKEIKRRGAVKEMTLDSQEINPWHEAQGNKEKYYGYFWAGMPDLNYDNPEVKEEIFRIGKYWLTEVGVDGFRLDAAKHIFPTGEEEKNHAFWVDFRKEMESAKKDVYLVGEVWDKAEVVAPYLKGLHALFNFDLGYAITKVVRNEQDTMLVRTHKNIRDYYNNIAPNFIDATFLTNHDQNRILSELKGNKDQAKMAASILLTLPGAPYLYYGEEIGMLGKKPDEQIREPFLWAPAGESKVQTSWSEAKHSTPDAVRSVQEQLGDTNSLLNHYKKVIALRRSSETLTLGQLELAQINNPNVVAFYRTHENDSMLVVHNITGNTVEVDLPAGTKNASEFYFTSNDKATVAAGKANLPAYSTVVFGKKAI
jgi:alpha-amylase